jgi:hypothetical protein
MVNKRGHKQSLVHVFAAVGIWNKLVSQVEDRWLGAHGYRSAHSIVIRSPEGMRVLPR